MNPRLIDVYTLALSWGNRQVSDRVVISVEWRVRIRLILTGRVTTESQVGAELADVLDTRSVTR